ncbi:MAG: 2-oxo-4-hydroxy-4-carboxy-5-ureidoimidazoline decarboxylase [Phototrophicaceae bacterium]
MKLNDLNTKSTARFLDLIGGALEGEVWLAERIVEKRPFTEVNDLYSAFAQVINTASEQEKIRLIASHPDLAPSVQTDLSEASIQEQASAGLNNLSPDEYATFNRLNTAYHQKFSFPFVICARENTKSSILEQFEARLSNTRSQEIEIGIAEILKIIKLRLTDLIDDSEI